MDWWRKMGWLRPPLADLKAAWGHMKWPVSGFTAYYLALWLLPVVEIDGEVLRLDELDVIGVMHYAALATPCMIMNWLFTCPLEDRKSPLDILEGLNVIVVFSCVLAQGVYWLFTFIHLIGLDHQGHDVHLGNLLILWGWLGASYWTFFGSKPVKTLVLGE